jgi:hypothetical protein
LLESTGEFKMILNESPGSSFNICNILSFSLGFLLAGENGRILVYQKSEEVKNPFFQLA